jgi:hypothetical protein
MGFFNFEINKSFPEFYDISNQIVIRLENETVNSITGSGLNFNKCFG